ncbi:MAG TPA: hydrogen gas-evolving membrane-bound hydrogenase subunit E [Pelomicrobium sp.]|nr:hydrogen gas-evolving membrane-bound hydrogenase subunit E [Pelomicrobium sp.]
MIERATRWLAAAAGAGLFALLAWAVLALPAPTPGLAPQVAARLEESGVRNPVTAVLLNFRGYDTLLEVTVLVLALLGAGFVRLAPHARELKMVGRRDPMLLAFARGMLPVMLTVGAYLLWLGSKAPGGAFQAAALACGAGLLLVLPGLWNGPRLAPARWRIALVAGYGVFLATAALTLAARGGLLDYPPAASGALILLVEASLAVSLGLLLLAFFSLGQPPREPGERSPS